MDKFLAFLFIFAVAPIFSQQPLPENPTSTGGPVRIGGSVQPPQVISSVEPEFTELGRRAKFKGNVQVYLWVNEKGIPSHVRVVKGVGLGLDEKAVEAVLKYKFKPAMQDGKPVTVELYIDVNFQIF